MNAFVACRLLCDPNAEVSHPYRPYNGVQVVTWPVLRVSCQRDLSLYTRPLSFLCGATRWKRTRDTTMEHIGPASMGQICVVSYYFFIVFGLLFPFVVLVVMGLFALSRRFRVGRSGAYLLRLTTQIHAFLCHGLLFSFLLCKNILCTYSRENQRTDRVLTTAVVLVAQVLVVLWRGLVTFGLSSAIRADAGECARSPSSSPCLTRLTPRKSFAARAIVNYRVFALSFVTTIQRILRRQHRRTQQNKTAFI